MPVEVFYSFAHQDEEQSKQLLEHLTPLQREGSISIWYSREIGTGTDWRREIDKHIDSAQIILLLISKSFLASDYCYEIEMKRALARQKAGEATVIPILLSPCDWKTGPFSHLQVMPRDARPISDWDDKDRAYLDVVEGLRKVLEQITISSEQKPIWSVAYPHNPFFTGRAEELALLHARWQHGQVQAISGLGGIGKTQFAMEYAYRHRQDYQAIFRVCANTLEALNDSYNRLASTLGLPQKPVQEQEKTVQAVRAWLETHQNWLLILDDLDEPDVLFPSDENGQPSPYSPFLPITHEGHILLTTRSSNLDDLKTIFGITHVLSLKNFTPIQGRNFLLKRAGRPEQAPLEDHETAEQIVRELGGLPLAINQAGAYLSATRESLPGYLTLFRQCRADLLENHIDRLYPTSVAKTWTISFERVARRNPAAADLLRFCAFLAPDAAIPEEIFTRGFVEIANSRHPLAKAVAAPLLFNEAIKTLRAYSLIERDPQTRTLTVHRLVQAVQYDNLSVKELHSWKVQVILAISMAFSHAETASWAARERLLPHAMLCAEWIEQTSMRTYGAAYVLHQAGQYLDEHTRCAEAAPFHHRALAINQQISGPDGVDTAESLAHLGNHYIIQEKYAEAMPCYQRAYEIYGQRLGTLHPGTANCLNNLARLHTHQANYPEAERLALLALTICQHLGPQHRDTLESTDTLAWVYAYQQKYTEAEPLYQQVLVIREQLLGASHPHTLASMDNLATLYKNWRKYKEAERLYQRALEIRERESGQQHPDTAFSLDHLAALYQSQRQYAKAEGYYQRALEIREQVYGQQHPSTAYSLSNLARVYVLQNKRNEAEAMYQRSMSVYGHLLGKSHPTTKAVQEEYSRSLLQP